MEYSFPPLYSLSLRTSRTLSHFHETSTLSPSFFPPGPLLQPIKTLKKNPTISRSQRSAYIRLDTLQNACPDSFTCMLSHLPTPHTRVFWCSHAIYAKSSLSFLSLPLVQIRFPLCLPILRSTTDSVSLRWTFVLPHLDWHMSISDDKVCPWASEIMFISS